MAGALRLDELEGSILLLTLDVPGQKVNTLSRPVREELAGIVADLEQRKGVRGLLFASGKPGQFIAGADLKELAGLAHATPEQVARELDSGHELFAALARLPFPTVALIAGACMGGGTELVLALDERLAADDPSTKIALPEVKVGLIPGWGGTQRLPRLVGLQAALEMITSGEAVDARKAAAIGLVFDAVRVVGAPPVGVQASACSGPSRPAAPTGQPEGWTPTALIDAGRRLVEELHAAGDWERNREVRAQPLGLSDDEMRFAFAIAEGMVRAQTKGQYPAPPAALRAIKEGINRTLADGLLVERQAALEVTGSEVSSNLIGVFFMQQAVARDAGRSGPLDRTSGAPETSAGRTMSRAEAASPRAQRPAGPAGPTPRRVARVGVLGGGLMGAGIAAAHARKNIPTVMVDVNEEQVAAGVGRAQHVVASRMKLGRATPEDMAAMLAHLSTSTGHAAFAACDVVIEAVPEKEDLKTKMFRALAKVLKPDAILASNTSTISITRMAEAAPHAERFAGLHFFYPVDRMQLVEVIRGTQTDDETVATLVALSKRIGKTPIVCNDCPGFLVNRILLPYMNEALLMLVEGIDMDAIDKAATKFGFPMGPIALHDLVGLDTAHSAGRVLGEAFSDRAIESPLLGDLVASGRLGKKTGTGFRQFVGKKQTPAPDPSFTPFLEKHRADARLAATDRERDATELTDRLILPMLVEATRILEENIVASPAHVDMGLILGIGFPPFRGGLLRWADNVGAQEIVSHLEKYRELGKRFEPTELLTQLAMAGGKFYPQS
ncbi:MAG: 3-hydroxyacyl-CoA dehydrogenase NAD-binding domain-containing protein [Planctomycetales bacterium]